MVDNFVSDAEVRCPNCENTDTIYPEDALSDLDSSHTCGRCDEDYGIEISEDGTQVISPELYIVSHEKDLDRQVAGPPRSGDIPMGSEDIVSIIGSWDEASDPVIGYFVKGSGWLRSNGDPIPSTTPIWWSKLNLPSTPKTEEPARSLRTVIASTQHDIWTHWMKYMFSVCVQVRLEAGNLVIPSKFEERWRRQMGTPYGELTLKEQGSDLEQADKVLEGMRRLLPTNQPKPNSED